MDRLQFDIQKALETMGLEATPHIFTSQRQTPKLKGRPLPLATEALLASYGTADLLPIEFFKQHADALRSLMPTPAVRTFLSSGTTRADRSQSHFSISGLEAYRQFSLATFGAVLRNFYPEPRQIKGFSLIPMVEEWPDSSLAQMLEWIGSEYNLSYWDGQSPLPDEPVWIFGTAFHFVNLADDGVRLQLPPGSLVIETGGTKGRSRSVTREELYTLIAEHLGLPKNRIVSEYGMCELASQAYDFVLNPNGPERKLSERWFRFPDWTPVAVSDRLSRQKESGEGTLVIFDQLRLDFPWPIRTEDLAQIRPDGSFQLLGRVPTSPLKGCSLLAENTVIPASPSAPFIPTHERHRDGIEERAEAIHTIAQSLLSDPKFQGFWFDELGNHTVTRWLLADLAKSFPKTPKDWLHAALGAVKPEGPQRWLVIPSESHSVTWLYPVLLGTVLGFELYVRAKTQDTLLRYMQQRLSHFNKLHIWDASQRIGVDKLPAIDAILVYGSDETIAQLKLQTDLPIQGFGSSLTVSVVSQSAWESWQSEIEKDAWSLMQKGCMSSRLLFLIGEGRSHDAAILAPCKKNSSPLGPWPLGVEAALEHGSFARRCRGLKTPGREQEGMPLFLLEDFQASQSISDYLADSAMSLPVILVSQARLTEFVNWLTQQKNLHKIAYNLKDPIPLPLPLDRFEIVNHGDANAPSWDGLHQGRPLFGL